MKRTAITGCPFIFVLCYLLYNIIKEVTPAIVIPQMGMQNGSVPYTVSIIQFLNKSKQ